MSTEIKELEKIAIKRYVYDLDATIKHMMANPIISNDTTNGIMASFGNMLIRKVAAIQKGFDEKEMDNYSIVLIPKTEAKLIKSFLKGEDVDKKLLHELAERMSTEALKAKA